MPSPVFILPNEAPIITSQVKTLNVYATAEFEYYVGHPIDMQEDNFYMKEINFGQLLVIPDWISFVQPTEDRPIG